MLPLATLLLPLLGAVLALPLGRASSRARTTVLGGICLATAGLTLLPIPAVLDGQVIEARILHFMPGLWIHLRIDAVGALFGTVTALLWLLTLPYTEAYLQGGPRLARYDAFSMLALLLTLGVAYAGNLVTFLVFYELFSLLVYPLIVHDETPEAMAAGTKYIIYVLVGGSLVMLGVIFASFLAVDQAFSAGGLLPAEVGRGKLTAIFWCLLAGFGVKAALMPLHGWVPDAHPAAPAPFSAILSGIMVAVGGLGIIRVVFEVFGVPLLRDLGVMPGVTWIALVTVVLGAILAIGQDDLKRRLAWSTISQMGYVTLVVSLLGAGAVVGALVHVAHHAFMKATLFLCAGLVLRTTGLRRVSEMAGLARRLPVTMAAMTVAAVGMIGTPPLAGFVSKWMLGVSMIEADQPLLLIVLLGGALLSAVYLLPIVYTVYFRQAPAGDQPATARDRPEASPAMLAPTVIGAALTVLLGLGALLPGLPLSLARVAAAALFR